MPVQIINLEGTIYATRRKITGPGPLVIVEAVADWFGIAASVILGRRRSQSIAFARHVAFYLVRKLTTLSLPEIGKVFFNRDHSTVLHGVRVVEESLCDEYTRKCIKYIEQTIREKVAA